MQQYFCEGDQQHYRHISCKEMSDRFMAHDVGKQLQQKLNDPVSDAGIRAHPCAWPCCNTLPIMLLAQISACHSALLTIAQAIKEVGPVIHGPACEPVSCNRQCNIEATWVHSL